MDRLFVPSNGMFHRLFVSGEKTWEMRGIDSRFNEKTVVVGRDVELRRGYQYDALWGKISEYVIVHSWEEVPLHIIDGVIPKSISNNNEVIEFVVNYVNKYKFGGLIIFKVVFGDSIHV